MTCVRGPNEVSVKSSCHLPGKCFSVDTIPQLITFDTSEAGERTPRHAHQGSVCLRCNFFRRPTKRCLPHKLLHILLKLWVSAWSREQVHRLSHHSANGFASSSTPSTGVLRQALSRLSLQHMARCLLSSWPIGSSIYCYSHSSVGYRKVPAAPPAAVGDTVRQASGPEYLQRQRAFD